ncbi:uncharacterized protein SOCEGT47_010970 [Sorangium cellulosum]|uniref:Transposase IS66 C-terminal domain-containing protein n=1 Tax=Sorangium cellulosum TaxID=56 RepID=A0A4P2PV97_SORCE|nr:uncharacterized protein SOCEGT47_010970 [Sorangium cellulosum]
MYLELADATVVTSLGGSPEGLKSWLFFGSDDHASAAANLSSLVASCKLHGLDPEAYLADVIRVMPCWPRERYRDLAPATGRAPAPCSSSTRGRMQEADSAYKSRGAPKTPSARDLDQRADLLGHGRPDVGLDARCLDAHDQRVPRAQVAPIAPGLVLPPAAHRVDRDDAALREVGGEAGEDVRVDRAAIASLLAEVPLGGVASSRGLLLVLFERLMVEALAELVHRLGRALHLEAQAVRRVAVASLPAAAPRVRLDEVGERDAQPHRRLAEALEDLARPGQLEEVDITHLPLVGLAGLRHERADAVLGDEGERVARATKRTLEAGHAEAVAPNESRSLPLAARTAQVRLHRRRPLGRVHDERAHRFGPQRRVLGGDHRGHAGSLCGRRARRPAQDEGPLGGPVVRREQAEVGARKVDLALGVRHDVATLEDDIGLDGPRLGERDTRRAPGREVPRSGHRLPARPPRVRDDGHLGKGADGERIPGLPRIVDRVSVAPVEVRRLESVRIDIARAQHEQPTSSLVAAVEVDEPARARVERAARRERVDGGGPGGGLASIALVGGSDRHRETAAPQRRLDLGAARCLRGDGAVELGRVLAVRRQDLHRLEAMPERQRRRASEHRREIAVESEPRHLGAVAVVVVGSPGRVAGLAIRGIERWLDQRVPAVHTGVEDTHRWRVRGGRRRSRDELLHPVALLVRAHVDEDRRRLLGLPHLGEVVQHVHGGRELRR